MVAMIFVLLNRARVIAASMAVLATEGDRPAPEGLKRSGERRIVRRLDLREEAELARWEKSWTPQDAVGNASARPTSL